ncbi:hypothetical protein PFDSM3638_04830 [Pyrococcus furiosus DSM 3638]|uniref:Uncharacterized protein n=3 Tax=Pyrococcus furiosus TaxID=2261 RepID=Q8U278_PYRFU|nr:hypothetical protein PF0961 [Pyrococcus furiosus DSM 3638]AFN03756.1 hypothetical protein PFC_04035 [Pyrococcus furiosus COM1]QEK78627.1 hypothetical protein PFDSM3638_04830 [Pyrococcus furiosus DSM 3638]
MKNLRYILFPFLLAVAGSAITFVIWIMWLMERLPNSINILIALSVRIAPTIGGIISFYRLCKESCKQNSQEK